jgi:glycosyltransferase involved in cell wall biosynthesis
MNISIIIPVYNCEKYIQESINSVLRDIELHDEILICNDCSTDNSLSEIGLIKDERIKIFTNDKNRGIAYTLNRLVAVAKNEIIARMDADDVWEMGRRNKVVEFYSAPNHSRFVLFGSYVVFKSGKLISCSSTSKQTNSKFFLFSLFINGDYLHPTMNIMKKELVKHKYNELLSGVEDIDLYMRLIGNGLTLTKSSDIFLTYRRESSVKKAKVLFSIQMKLVKEIFKRFDFVNGITLAITYSIVYIFKSVGLYRQDRKFIR